MPNNNKSNPSPKTQITKNDAARIQSSNAKSGSGQTSKGSFPARTQAAADKNKK